MEKLPVIINIVQGIYGRLLFRRLLSGAMIVLGLTIVISMMMGAILISSFYGIYLSLLHSGYTPQTALIITGGSSVLTALLIIVLTFSYLRHLRHVPQKVMQEQLSALQANEIIESFLDGFNGTTKKE